MTTARPLRVGTTSTRLLVLLLVAALVGAWQPGSAAASTLPPAEPGVRVVSPREPSDEPTFQVEVEVTAVGSPVTSVKVQVRNSLVLVRALAPACTSTCTVVFDVDTVAWRSMERFSGDPLHLSGDALVATAAAADGGTGHDEVPMTAPVRRAGVERLAANPRERDLPRLPAYTYLLADDVRHLAASGTQGVSVPAARVEARLVAREGGAVVRTASAVPVVDPRGRWHVDDLALETATLPDGWYDVTVRALDEMGRYGSGQRLTIGVRHPPYATWETGPTSRVVGDDVFVTVRLPGPLPVHGSSLRAVLTLAPAGTTTGPTTTTEYPVVDASGRWLTKETGGEAGFNATAVSAVPGTWIATWQLHDDGGRAFGESSRTTYTVRPRATARWGSVPLAWRVAQRAMPLSVELTAPEGLVIEGCRMWVESATGQEWWDDVGTASCPTRRRTTGTAQLTLWDSGDYTLKGTYWMDGRPWPLPDVPIRVAPRTRVAVTVPDLVHGQRVEARADVTVLDHLPGSASPAPSGKAVAFDVRWAGSSTWTRVGVAKTGADGVARLPVVPQGSGTWRAFTMFGRDAGTPKVMSREDPSLVRAAVRITSAPARATAGRAFTTTGTVSPGALGPRAVLQARAPGSSTWADVATAAVASSGAVSTRAALPSAGSWQLRLVQPGTSLVARGTSPTATVVVG